MPSRTGMSLRLLWETGWNSSLPNFRWVSGSFLRPCPHWGRLMPPPLFLLTFSSCDLAPNTQTRLFFHLICAPVSLESHRFCFAFNPHLIPQCGETLLRPICHTYHCWLKKKKEQMSRHPVYGCKEDIMMIRHYFSRSGLDQTRTLLV